MDSVNHNVENLKRLFEQTLPSPRIANAIRSLVEEESTNPDEILSLIRLEPLLATRMLREANLLPEVPAAGLNSIEEAVTAIGFQRMYDLLSLYAYPSAPDDICYSTDAWKRAVTCAVCMENLAERHRIDRFSAYTVGLLNSLAASLLEAKTPAAHDGEEETLVLNRRFDHQDYAEQSYALLRSYELPDSLIDPIRYQYSPLDCQTTGKMACLLNLSKWITGVVRECEELPDQAMGPDVLVLNLLGEGEQTLWNLVTEVSDSLHHADSILQGKQSFC